MIEYLCKNSFNRPLLVFLRKCYHFRNIHDNISKLPIYSFISIFIYFICIIISMRIYLQSKNDKINF